MIAPQGVNRRRQQSPSEAEVGHAAGTRGRPWADVLVRGSGGRPGVLLEVIGLLVVVLAFTRLHAVLGTDVAVATANAVSLQSIEHAAHIDIERTLNAWLAGHELLSHLAVYVYRLYYLVVAGVLAWVFVRHAAVYRQVRRTMVAMLVLVLPAYWLAPMSPPRFALPGVVDIVAAYDIAGGTSWGAREGQNYSAMPSMHVGWSLWCAYAVWFALRPAYPRLALLAWTFPLLMTVDVIATGNHYVLDVAGGIVLVALAVLVARACGHLVQRWRRLPLAE